MASTPGSRPATGRLCPGAARAFGELDGRRCVVWRRAAARQDQTSPGRNRSLLGHRDSFGRDLATRRARTQAGRAQAAPGRAARRRCWRAEAASNRIPCGGYDCRRPRTSLHRCDDRPVFDAAPRRYVIVKLTVTVRIASKPIGAYFHCLTASIADRANASFVDRSTVMSPIVPSA